MNTYLLGYNSALLSGWALCLIKMMISVYDGGSLPQVWEAIKLPLAISQTAAILEVVHSATGIVRSPLIATGLQVASRIGIFWGIMMSCQKDITSGGVTLYESEGFSFKLNLITLILAWSVTEIIRYGFFAIKELDAVGPFLKWLRYSSFIVLYPLGVASELTMVYLAMDTIKRSGMWSIQLPNKWNFGFEYYYFVWFCLLLYIPGFPFLYTYMLKQRSKNLGKRKIE
eukprot:TRINITY_DN57986_c0_g1_i3.p3 TRINITY_DN57986_c0_g1~~TRINITY_DN57986_c0_g1_i3.p3  ORF type:complete len:228 (+),score=9.62 TRINITY_DN57986_c0_g1_i3:50-733(+)